MTSLLETTLKPHQFWNTTDQTEKYLFREISRGQF
jgi:hypothetical protein